MVVVAALALFAAFGRHWQLALPILAFLAWITAFYAYFNPPDAMLYSVQLRPALFVLMTLGALSLPGSPRMAMLALAAVATLLGARNLPIALTGSLRLPGQERPPRDPGLGARRAVATCNYRQPGSPRCRAAALPDGSSAGTWPIPYHTTLNR